MYRRSPSPPYRRASDRPAYPALRRSPPPARRDDPYYTANSSGRRYRSPPRSRFRSPSPPYPYKRVIIGQPASGYATSTIPIVPASYASRDSHPPRRRSRSPPPRGRSPFARRSPSPRPSARGSSTSSRRERSPRSVAASPRVLEDRRTEKTRLASPQAESKSDGPLITVTSRGAASDGPLITVTARGEASRAAAARDQAEASRNDRPLFSVTPHAESSRAAAARDERIYADRRDVGPERVGRDDYVDRRDIRDRSDRFERDERDRPERLDRDERDRRPPPRELPREDRPIPRESPRDVRDDRPPERPLYRDERPVERSAPPLRSTAASQYDRPCKFGAACYYAACRFTHPPNRDATKNRERASAPRERYDDRPRIIGADPPRERYSEPYPDRPPSGPRSYREEDRRYPPPRTPARDERPPTGPRGYRPERESDYRSERERDYRSERESEYRSEPTQPKARPKRKPLTAGRPPNLSSALLKDQKALKERRKALLAKSLDSQATTFRCLRDLSRTETEVKVAKENRTMLEEIVEMRAQWALQSVAAG